MKLDQHSIAGIREYTNAEPEKRTLLSISSIYWKVLIDEIVALVHAKASIEDFLRQEFDFINFGITSEFFPGEKGIAAHDAIANRTDKYPEVKVKLFSEWIVEMFARISNADKKDLIERDIKKLEIDRIQLKEEIEAQQSARKDFLLTLFIDTLDKMTFGLIENLDKTDVLCRENLVTKRTVGKGKVMSVEERREFAARNAAYQKEVARNDGLLTRMKANDEKKRFRDGNTSIVELLEKSVITDDQVNDKHRELLMIADQNQKLSPMEIETSVRTELEYVRDLVKLVARRLRMESCSLLKPDDPCFSVGKVYECLDRISEFDPQLFNNERVSYIGKPSVLLLPGNGNAIYDWKNNQIVIPLVPTGGNFMGSIATGIVEYRIDVDEEKKMMNSFQKIPENKLVKSIITLRANLTRDYLKWMTSEYIGFKVLSRESRQWFEHEIGPRKNEMYCPQEFQPFSMDQKKFKEVYEATEQRLAGQGSETRLDDLWVASVMALQSGKDDEAIKYLEELVEKKPDHKFAWYNFGIACMKNSRASDAQRAFKEFVTRGARSWWTAVAADHFRRIMEGQSQAVGGVG